VPTYTVDPILFQADGAVVNWDSDAKRLGVAPDPNRPYGSAIELRWMLKADVVGLPTEPFLVWARPHSASAGFKPLAFTQQQLLFAGDVTLIAWPEGSMSSLSLDVNTAAAGSVFAFAAGPLFSNIAAAAGISAGTSTVNISAPLINCLVVSQGVTVSAVRGLPQGGYANTPGWSLVEIVGLPVKQAEWSGIGKHGEPQGLVAALTDAPTAAVARLTRGAPPFGWGPLITAGVPAPAWVAPNFTALMGEVNTDLLEYLRDVVKNNPPNQQASMGVTVPLPPPQNSLGQYTNKPGSTTQLYPLGMAYMAASTDAMLSLALGFGTAYPLSRNDLATVGNVAHDFMVTAHWEQGFDGASAPQDYAAVIPATNAAVPPPTPANMGTQPLGPLRPFNANGDWRESVRVFWDRPPAMQLFRAASCALARVSTSPAQAAVALMDKRSSGGYRYIAINGVLGPPHAQDPEWWRVHAMDREIDIPFNPGSRQLKYGAAVQNLYGQWSPWVPSDQTIVQPDLDAVRMMNVTLRPVAPAGGSVCATTLELDFLWDWRVRTPQQITFVGSLYAAADHGAPPPSAIPAGLDRSLGGGGAALVVTFSGDTPSAPGCSFVPFTEDGNSQPATFGPGQGDARRYRMTLTNLALDFASTGFVGMAIWAQGQESIAPNRLSPWQLNPAVTSTGDPRPPVVTIFHVKLGSIPDAAGSSHVQVSWAAQPNAAGYFIYEATEASLLDAWSLPEPSQKDTLDARLKVLRDQFQANPVRRPFTRWNSTLLKSTGADITLPKGSTGIHVFVVLGVSAGQVESEWPSGPTPQDALIPVAAPHITRPAPPMIEVRQVLDASAMPPAYKANVLVTTRPGPRAAMVELYRVRVDDAAVEVDTMGPPVARLKSTAGGWLVNQSPDPDYGPYITTVQGIDAPPGSWRRVWYRAAAWTGADDTRGGLPGRSEASNAAWVVLPPPDGPAISALSVGGGPTLADAIIEWTCAAPLKRTPLGPHLISVRASLPGTPPLVPILSMDSTLDALVHTPPATGSGVWIVSSVAGVTTYRAMIRRAAVTDIANFAVRITDPIGRTGSQLLTIASGPVDPPPDLENLLKQTISMPPPPRIALSFSSTSPVLAPLSGPYVLRVTGIPVFPIPFPPPFSVTMPLGSVPTKLPIGPPPPSYILRSGAGPLYSYRVVTTAHLKGFVVRISAPNGQFVEKTV
jgi:hypothetical protein